jgi:hypothetical protein
LPFNISEFSPIEAKKSDAGIIIMSGATSFKYKTAAGLSFPQLVGDILAAISDAKMIIIGPTINLEWGRVLLRYPKRLEIRTKLPYEQYKQLMETIDVYIDSFPLSGGTTVPEVRSQNIPVTGVLCGSYGYTPWDKTKYKSNAHLVRALKEFSEVTNSDIVRRNNDKSLIEECNNVHSFSKFKQRLLEIVTNNTSSNLEFDHDVNYSYFNHHWKSQEKLVLGKKSYIYLIENWQTGGREIMILAVLINPFKYGMKLLAGYLKLFSYRLK